MIDKKKKGRGLFIVGGTILCLVAGVILANFFANVPEPSAQAPKILSSVPGSFSPLVKQARQSVVNLSTVKVVEGGRFFPFGQEGPFDDWLERFFERQVPREFRQTTLGSGFIIDKDGFILTNNHVVEGTDEIKVKLINEKEYDAKIIARDPKTDLALIRIETEEDLIPLSLGDSDRLEVGDWVVAIGNPFGLGHTVTAGIVSAKYRHLGLETSTGPYDNFIQTDAPINLGNSGGPLLNIQGEVVGINSAIYSRSGGNVGIGFAIPVNTAKDLLPQLKKGEVVRGWLGVSIQEITTGLKEKFKLEDEEGALVADVVSGGPAEKAGIERGDVIISIDGKKTRKVQEVQLIVASTPVGKHVKVEVMRKGKKKSFEVEIAKLEEAQEGKEPVEEKSDLGMTVKEITPELARQFGLSEEGGLVVTQVEDGSPAEEARILQGDMVLEIDQEPVTNLEAYRKRIRQYKKGDTILFLVKRSETTLYLTLKLRE